MRRTVRHRKHRGGKIIGEGATSYVIDPPPACKNRSDESKYVARLSKVKTLRNKLTRSYPTLIQRLRKIDPKQKYFYYPEPCDVETLTEENKKDGITEQNKKYIELIRKGKEKWFDWRNPDAWRNPSQEQIQHLRKAIDLLHKNKIVHGDLHGDNVIYGEDDMPRIIDFSESVHNAPKDYIEQEEEFVQRGWPTLEYYKVYQSDTPEGKEINEKRKEKRRELLKTRKK
jgi:serine/threonine protein kinase